MITNTKSINVWRVLEYVVSPQNPKEEILQECFVLATSAQEAAEIVGEDESRQIIEVRQLCCISQLPGNRYKVVPICKEGAK